MYISNIFDSSISLSNDDVQRSGYNSIKKDHQNSNIAGAFL